jgi:hypothetical protein
MFFDEVDVLQRHEAGPIPEEIWIPLSSQEVGASVFQEQRSS